MASGSRVTEGPLVRGGGVPTLYLQRLGVTIQSLIVSVDRFYPPVPCQELILFMVMSLDPGYQTA